MNVFVLNFYYPCENLEYKNCLDPVIRNTLVLDIIKTHFVKVLNKMSINKLTRFIELNIPKNFDGIQKALLVSQLVKYIDV